MTKKEVRAKRRARRTIVRTIIIIIVMTTMCALASYVDTHYTREATIIHTADNYYAVAVDKQGNEWEFCADNVFVGQIIEMKMFTNHTTTIYDDEVVGVKIVAEVK